MDTISISTLATLAGKWQAEADAHVTSPITYGTASMGGLILTGEPT